MSHPIEDPTIVLVHGAWNGPHVWDQLRHYLREFDTVAVDLPSASPDPTRLGDLQDDADTLRSAVREIDGPVVVVAHSYGGAVATEALTDCPNVQQIIYLTAFAPDTGESVYELIAGQVPNWATTIDDTAIEVRHPHRVFYNDCTPQQARQAARQLVYQSLSSLQGPITDPAWRHIPSTYLLCTRDRTLHPAAQAVMSARCDQLHRLRADHSPMIGQPDALADLLRTVITCHAPSPWPYRG